MLGNLVAHLLQGCRRECSESPVSIKSGVFKQKWTQKSRVLCQLEPMKTLSSKVPLYFPTPGAKVQDSLIQCSHDFYKKMELSQIASTDCTHVDNL